MENSLGKQRRKRRKASHCRKEPAKSPVPSDTMERIIHLHNVEYKGFRKIGDELGMTKDRAYRIYKQYSATFEEQKQRMFSQDPQYLSLKKTEQEIERKTKRDLRK